MSAHNYALIMAGGSGTRLWPLSRSKAPKQFQRLHGDESLYQHMLRLTTGAISLENIFVMAIPEFRDTIFSQSPGLPDENFLLEPSLRDNGPAIILGMLQIKQRDPEAVVAILWSDHLILQEDGYIKTLSAAFEAAREHPKQLVTIGTKPTSADPSLGYIKMGKEIASYSDTPVYSVQQFIEKPGLEDAQSFIRRWEYLWNVGYKVIAVDDFLNLFSEAQLEHKALLTNLENSLENIEKNKDEFTAAYEAFPKLSIEYLFTQYLKDILVVPSDMGWSDVGTWSSLYDIYAKGKSAVTSGPVTAEGTSGCLIYAKDRPIVALNTQDLIAVDTGDVILLMDRSTPASDLKDLINNRISSSNPELL